MFPFMFRNMFILRNRWSEQVEHRIRRRRSKARDSPSRHHSRDGPHTNDMIYVTWILPINVSHLKCKTKVGLQDKANPAVYRKAKMCLLGITSKYPNYKTKQVKYAMKESVMGLNGQVRVPDFKTQHGSNCHTTVFEQHPHFLKGTFCFVAPSFDDGAN